MTLLDLLDSYHCYRMPTCTNVKEILCELAHQELIQKPRYIANCFASVFQSRKSQSFETPDDVIQFYKQRSVSSLKVVKCLSMDEDNLNDNKRSIFSYLKRFVKSLDKKDLNLFLRFCTGGDTLPMGVITVTFDKQDFRAPRARTCVSTLSLADTYSCYNELAEEFSNALKNPDTFIFSFI